MIQLHCGDCLEVLKQLDAGSVDCVVTDPPYGLGFMGKRWDASLPALQVWGECLRVLKPGGYLLAFGGTRTFHRLISSIEDAGFEIRDSILTNGYEDAPPAFLAWEYGSGFPKGKGCLKPAWEPITLARKPGGKVWPLGIDECRVETEESTIRNRNAGTGNLEHWRTGRTAGISGTDSGRWPPNLLLSHHPACNGQCHPDCVVRLLGEQSGTLTSGKAGANGHTRNQPSGNCIYGNGKGLWQEVGPAGELYGDSGTAARFYPQFRYAAKASRSERNRGCEGIEKQPNRTASNHANGAAITRMAGESERKRGLTSVEVTRVANHHPTVKPLAVMEWLVKLACPPGGLVLDPFAGSGTTGVACVRTGRRFLGIEIDPAYFTIAQRRIAAEQAKTPLLDSIA